MRSAVLELSIWVISFTMLMASASNTWFKDRLAEALMIEGWGPEVASDLKHYVCRLVDPRNREALRRGRAREPSVSARQRG